MPGAALVAGAALVTGGAAAEALLLVATGGAAAGVLDEEPAEVDELPHPVRTTVAAIASPANRFFLAMTTSILSATADR